MCLEDLKLGKGRFSTQPVNGTPQSAVTPLLPADPRRVAVSVSISGWQGANANGDIAVLTFGGVGNNSGKFVINAGQGPYLFRVEDYGMMVTADLSYTLTDVSTLGESAITAFGVCSNVTADPIPGILK